MKKKNSTWCAGAGMFFCDLGHKNADAEQFKAILAAEIIKAIDRERLTVRAAHSSRLLAHPQCGPRAVHRGPSHVNY
jgi:hypothetical protein